MYYKRQRKSDSKKHSDSWLEMDRQICPTTTTSYTQKKISWTSPPKGTAYKILTFERDDLQKPFSMTVHWVKTYNECIILTLHARAIKKRWFVWLINDIDYFELYEQIRCVLVGAHRVAPSSGDCSGTELTLLAVETSVTELTLLAVETSVTELTLLAVETVVVLS